MEHEWVFDTTVGAGSEIVTVVYEYEVDGDGPYNENIKEIWFEWRDVIGLLSEEQFKELEIEAAMRFQQHIIDEADHAKSVDYDMRNI